MKFKEYIWDFDGTLFDSYPHTLQCLWMVLEEEGIAHNFDREMVARYLQVSYGEMKKFTGISDDAYARMIEYNSRMGEAEIEPHVDIFEGALEVLQNICQAGGRNYLYTHSGNRAIALLEKFGVKEYFADWITADAGFPMKPAPDAILALIARNRLDPKDCVMIGDREIDGMAGKNAGICGALVNYPDLLPNGKSPAEVTAMDFVAKTLREFWEIVK